MVGLIDEIIRILNQPAAYLESITQRRQLLQKLGQLWQLLPVDFSPAKDLSPKVSSEDAIDLSIEVIAKINEIIWLLWDSPLWQGAAAKRSWQDFVEHYRQFVVAQIRAYGQINLEAKDQDSPVSVPRVIYDLHQQLGMAFFKRGLWAGAVFGFELAWLSLAPVSIFNFLAKALPEMDLEQLATQVNTPDLLIKELALLAQSDPQWGAKAGSLLCNLGAAWAMQATDVCLHQAIDYYHQAVAVVPNLVPAHFNLGAAYFRLENWDLAIAHLETALFFKPDYAEACTKLGAVLVNRQQSGDLAQAIAYHERAIQLCLETNSLPNGNYSITDAYYNLAIAQTQNYDTQAAITSYEKALSSCAANHKLVADVHTNLSLLLLAQGNLERGWQEYEWRWQTHHLDLPMAMDCPRWQGEDLQGKVIFLFTEQGFGDAIQFCRYVPLVAERGARVILQCQPEIKRLLTTLAGVTWLVTAEEPIPEFDYYAPLMSLPQIFGTTLEIIPAAVPYLQPSVCLPLPPQFDLDDDAQLLQNLQQCFPKPLQIGIVWSSSAKGHLDYQKFQGQKSVDLALLLECFDVAQMRIYSLQVGPETGILEQQSTAEPSYAAANAMAEYLLTERLVPLHPYITDFADTAGFISQMDLIITIDTAVAHLAGALAKPTWVLLSYHSDWRWLGDCPGHLKEKYQSHSPWYPTMQLFRQCTPGDWHGVIKQVKQALRSF